MRAAPSAARAALALVLGVVAATGLGAPAGAASSAGAPRQAGVLSPGGLTVGDGQRSLRVAQATELSPAGQQVAVAGSGYDTDKGVYVALCLVTPADRPPSPCGGGIDIDGVSGASAWISSNPPSYGEGLAIPYGEGGTFSVTVSVSPVLAGGFDCRQVQCAIVTRNDHVRTADRSQDLAIPVRFGAGEVAPPAPVPAPAPEVPASTAPAPTAPPTTLAPPPAPTTAAPAPAPEATLSADGRTARVGARSVTVSQVEGLGPDGDVVTVEGQGFDEATGVLVSLCRVSEDRSLAPNPCFAGSTPNASRWISSSPPDFAPDTVVPFDAGGRFSVQVDVAAILDAATDCRELDCALVVRRDDTAPDDRSLDLAVPVSFSAEAAPAPSSTEAQLAAAPTGSDGGGGSSAVPWIVGAVVVVGVGAMAVLAVRRRRRDTQGEPSPPAGDASPLAGEAS